MAQSINTTVLDQTLLYIKNNATQVTVCSAEPTTYAEATATYMLAAKTGLTPASFTVAANGAGRKVTMAQQTDVTVTNSGTATHIALCSGDTLLVVATMTSRVFTAGNEAKINFTTTIGLI